MNVVPIVNVLDEGTTGVVDNDGCVSESKSSSCTSTLFELVGELTAARKSSKSSMEQSRFVIISDL